MLYDGSILPKLARRICFQFYNETAYYSLQAVLSSRSSFTPFSHPAGHSMNTLYAIRRFHHLQIVPKKLFSILQMRLNITGCRLFFAPASLFTPSPRPAGRSINTVCYMTVRSCPNWPEEFISNFTNETAYSSPQAVLCSRSSFTPLSHPRDLL